MSKMYDKIKSFYDKGLWNEAMVKDAVNKNKITAEEYSKITGESYEA